jgi:hypothetical protein
MRISMLFAGAAALLLSADPAIAQPPPGAGRLFASPAGEVFRSSEGGPPLQAWFARADGDHDGALTYAEVRADFARVFALFDTDGDGEIEPDEVSHYEIAIFPEMGRFGVRGGGGAGFSPGARSFGPAGRGGRRGGVMRQGPGWASMAGAGRFGLLPISHPIMDADADFNRGVTRAEFDAAAGRRFNQLNVSGSGRLTLEELVALRRSRRGPSRQREDD